MNGSIPINTPKAIAEDFNHTSVKPSSKTVSAISSSLHSSLDGSRSTRSQHLLIVSLVYHIGNIVDSLKVYVESFVYRQGPLNYRISFVRCKRVLVFSFSLKRLQLQMKVRCANFMQPSTSRQHSYNMWK